MEAWLRNLSFAFLALAIYVSYVFNEVNILGLTELNRSPVIYGDEQCPNLFANRIRPTQRGLLNVILTYLASKTVVRAQLHNEAVCLKRLATSNEIEFVDLLFASTFKSVEFNQMSISLVKIEILKNIINHEPTNAYNGVQKIYFCPKLNKIDQILVHIPGFNFTDVFSYIRVWTMILLNAEPLILQILQPPEWPVPKYYGSCGRLAVVEDCGDILTDFQGAPWPTRADLGVQLLEAAIRFTTGHPDLAFYFTDPSPDNIAVDWRGRIKFIDLEHVIIVDKNPPNEQELPNWKLNHTTKHIPCTKCYSFNPEDLCEHQISDFNILSVCREVLHDTSLLIKGGLLGVPRPTENSFDDKLTGLLDECVDNKNGRSRFDIADDIISLLEKGQNL